MATWLAIAAFVVSVVSMVVSGLSFYYQYIRDDFRLIAMQNIDVDKPDAITVALAFSNPGNRTILVQDIHLMEIKGTMQSKPVCADASALQQYEYAIVNPTGKPL
jgi:hypothetical protein